MRHFGWSASSYYARVRYSALPLAMLCVACAVPAFAAASVKGPARAKANLRGTAAERLEAADAARFRRAGAPKAAELDAAVAREANPQIRCRLLQALTAQDASAAVPALTRALRTDAASIVRVVAAQELGRLSEPAATGALASALAADADADVRKASAVSLGLHRSAAAVAALAAAARNGDAGLRAHAALGLSRQPAGRERDAALSRLERDADAGVAAKARAWRRARKGAR